MVGRRRSRIVGSVADVAAAMGLARRADGLGRVVLIGAGCSVTARDRTENLARALADIAR